MKAAAFSTLVLLGTLAHPAFAGNDAFAQLHISDACEQKIFETLRAECNQDSANDPSREHGCLFNGQLEVLANDANSAVFSADFTVTDADDYNYNVTIEDKAACKFVAGHD